MPTETFLLLANFIAAMGMIVLGIALLSGIGFTVSLLIGELAFGVGSDADDHVKIAVLTGSLLAAVLAALVLVRRNRHFRAVEARELADHA